MMSSPAPNRSHDHVFLGPHHGLHARRTLWTVIFTAVMTVVEIVSGFLFQSMALLADGFHMATHAGALSVAAAAYAYSRRHAHDRRYSFGTGKVGDLAGFASAMALGLVAIGVGIESLGRLFDPREIAFDEATAIALLGLLVNLICAALLGNDHNHPSHGKDRHDHARHADHNLRSAYWHVLADALTSVLAIVALLGGRYLGWMWLDPAMGLAGAAMIAVWSRHLLRDTALVLLDAADLELERIIRRQIETPGGGSIADLHVWRIGPGAYAAIVSVTGIDGATVRQRLASVGEIAHLTVDAG